MHFTIDYLSIIIMANVFTYISAADPGEPLSLTMAGKTDPDSTGVIRRSANTEITVFQYITYGRGFVFNGDRNYTAAAGDFFIVSPRRTHHYYPDPRDPWGKVWLNLTGDLPEELLRIYGIAKPYLFPGCHEAGEIVTETVEHVASLPREKVAEYASCQVLKIIRLLSRFQPKPRRINCKALQLRDFLHSKLAADSPSLEEMSRKIDLSPIQTIRIFRDEFGTTPYAYLLNQKIDIAAEMLNNTENSIKEIAEHLGFANEYYFSRLFKQKKGLPPGAYRRQED